jgi:hypothetical protein
MVDYQRADSLKSAIEWPARSYAGRCRPRALRQVQGIKFGLYKSVSTDVTGALFEPPSGMSVVNFEAHEGAP